jgi:hypothetical protein
MTNQLGSVRRIPVCTRGHASELATHRETMGSLTNMVTRGANVDLGRSQRRMPEQRLHDVERLAAADELHGESYLP